MTARARGRAAALLPLLLFPIVPPGRAQCKLIQFGWSVTLDGSVAAVGSPRHPQV